MAKGRYHDWITEDGLLLIRGWARDGLADLDIAKKMGISKATFYVWAAKFTAIRDALKKGRKPVVEEVEDSIYKSARGYFVTEETRTTVKGPGGEVVEERITSNRRWIKPETAAQIYTLNNRKPDRWANNPKSSAAADDRPMIVIDIPKGVKDAGKTE